MTDDQSTEILNDAYAAECRGLLNQFGHLHPFVSWLSAADQPVTERIVAEQQEHKRWLVERILELRRAPRPAGFGEEAAAVAYLDLRFLLARIVDDTRKLISVYEAAAVRAAGDPRTSGLLSRILERHRAHLAQLSRILSASSRPVPAGRSP